MDPSGCRLGAAELLVDEQLSGLESVLVQLGAREAVVNKVGGGAGGPHRLDGQGGLRAWRALLTHGPSCARACTYAHPPGRPPCPGPPPPQDALAQLDVGQRSRLEGLLASVGLMATHRPASLFATKHLEADLAKVIKARVGGVWGLRL